MPQAGETKGQREAVTQDSARGSANAELDELRGKRIRRGVVMPFGIALLMALAFFAAALALPAPEQVAVLSDAALTLLILMPLALCLFPLVIASLALVALMRRWTEGSLSPLRRLEGWAAALERNADGWLRGIDQRVLDWAVAFAPIRQLLRTFDTMEDESRDEDES